MIEERITDIFFTYDFSCDILVIYIFEDKYLITPIAEYRETEVFWYICDIFCIGIICSSIFCTYIVPLWCSQKFQFSSIKCDDVLSTDVFPIGYIYDSAYFDRRYVHLYSLGFTSTFFHSICSLDSIRLYIFESTNNTEVSLWVVSSNDRSPITTDTTICIDSITFYRNSISLFDEISIGPQVKEDIDRSEYISPLRNLDESLGFCIYRKSFSDFIIEIIIIEDDRPFRIRIIRRINRLK